MVVNSSLLAQQTKLPLSSYWTILVLLFTLPQCRCWPVLHQDHRPAEQDRVSLCTAVTRLSFGRRMPLSDPLRVSTLLSRLLTLFLSFPWWFSELSVNLYLDYIFKTWVGQVKVARNEVENASFAQRSAHRDSRIWRPELIEPAAERKRRVRWRRPAFKSAFPDPQILPQCNISSNYPL